MNYLPKLSSDSFVLFVPMEYILLYKALYIYVVYKRSLFKH
jgi:hypothetical protein